MRFVNKATKKVVISPHGVRFVEMGSRNRHIGHRQRRWWRTSQCFDKHIRKTNLTMKMSRFRRSTSPIPHCTTRRVKMCSKVTIAMATGIKKKRSHSGLQLAAQWARYQFDSERPSTSMWRNQDVSLLKKLQHKQMNQGVEL